MFGFGKSKNDDLAPQAEQRSLAAPTDIELAAFGIAASIVGASVNATSAMRVPAVTAGVRAISEALGTLPLHAYQRASSGSRERVVDHPAYALLNADATPWMRGPQLRELLTADAIVYGNGLAQIVRDSTGQPRELHRLHPQSFAIEIDRLTGEPSYRISLDAGQRVLSYLDVLHIRAPSSLVTDAIRGKSLLMEASTAIGLLITLQGNASRLFANGGRPSGILSVPGRLGAEVVKRMAASWKTAHGGESSGGTAILEEGATWKGLQFSSVDSQFMEVWSLAITEVARVLRVPPVLLMDYSRQTWANAETGGQQFLTYTLAPWLSRWEAEVTLKLIPADDRADYFVEHLTDALLRADFAARATAYGQYRSMGVMTANEVRAGLNLAPMADGNTLQNPYTTSQPGAADE